MGAVKTASILMQRVQLLGEFDGVHVLVLLRYMLIVLAA